MFVQVLVEIAAELRQIGAAGRKDPLAVGIVRERIQQVLERQVRMTPRGASRYATVSTISNAWLNTVVPCLFP